MFTDLAVLNAKTPITDPYEIESLLDGTMAVKERVYLQNDTSSWGSEFKEIPKARAIVIDGETVGMHTVSYGVLQHAALAETAARLVQDLPELVEGVQTYFTTRHGQRAVIGLKMRHRIDILGYAKVDHLFNLANDHGGGSARCTSSMLNWTCMNQYSARIVRAQAVFALRHTSNVEQLYRESANSLTLAVHQTAELEETIQRLASTPFNSWEFGQLVQKLIGDRPDTRTAAWDAKVEGLWDRWRGDDIRPIANTKWAALMAVQGYEQHLAPQRGRVSRQLTAAARMHFGSEQSITSRARDLIGVAA